MKDLFPGKTKSVDNARGENEKKRNSDSISDINPGTSSKKNQILIAAAVLRRSV